MKQYRELRLTCNGGTQAPGGLLRASGVVWQTAAGQRPAGGNGEHRAGRSLRKVFKHLTKLRSSFRLDGLGPAGMSGERFFSGTGYLYAYKGPLRGEQYLHSHKRAG